MPNPDQNGLIKKQGLSPEEIALIEELAQLCDAYDHATLRVNWGALTRRPADEVNDFLYYQDGALVGALSLYAFGRREAEASGMVHPDHRRRGIFRALVEAAIDELRRRSIPKLIFFCDSRSSSGIAFLDAIGTQFEHSEYRMDLEAPQLPDAFDEQLLVERAREEDVDTIAHIVATGFDMPVDEDLRQSIVKGLHTPSYCYYVARLHEVTIGSLFVSIDDKGAGIYGFAVLPEYRGRGYGRQILAQAIQYALDEGPQQLFLEVAPENNRALGLYRSCGFRETSRYDYYSLQTDAGRPIVG